MSKITGKLHGNKQGQYKIQLRIIKVKKLFIIKAAKTTSYEKRGN